MFYKLVRIRSRGQGEVMYETHCLVRIIFGFQNARNFFILSIRLDCKGWIVWIFQKSNITKFKLLLSLYHRHSDRGLVSLAFICCEVIIFYHSVCIFIKIFFIIKNTLKILHKFLSFGTGFHGIFWKIVLEIIRFRRLSLKRIISIFVVA